MGNLVSRNIMVKLMAVTLLLGVMLVANAFAAPSDLDEQAPDLAKEPVEEPSDLEDEADVEDRDEADEGEDDDGDNAVGEEGDDMRDDLGDEPFDINEDEESLADYEY